MTKNEMVRLLTLAEGVLWDAAFRGVPMADDVQGEIARALRKHAAETADGKCLKCGNALTQPDRGRRRSFCSDRCRVAAHREARQR
jgi:hypothetical protein